MNISIYGCLFLKPLMISLEKDGHKILYDQFSENLDILIAEGYFCMYRVYRILKKAKRHKVKLVNIIYDLPPYRLEENWHENTLFRTLKQIAYHNIHKNTVLTTILNSLLSLRGDRTQIFSKLINRTLNRFYQNRFFFQVNYKKYLESSDLVLSISKYTQFVVKKLLNVDSSVFYWCVNSDILSKIKPSEIRYDAINISRIVKTKRQQVFVEAANKLGLKIAVIGKHHDKTIKLDCPHYPLNYEEAMKTLMASRFYVDPSELEGFGLTPVEAAFLNKPTIASNTYVHREVLGDYPLYFKLNDVEDLVDKMQVVINGNYSPKKEAIDKLKKRYSLEAAKERFWKHIKKIL